MLSVKIGILHQDMMVTFKQISYQEIRKMIFIATKIIVGIHVLIYFGTSLVVCNNDIPFCRKRLKELRKDEKDWSERCLNGEGQNLDTPSCEAEKEYNHERMCMYTKICFYKEPYAEPYLLIKSKSEIHAIDLTTLNTTVIIGGIAGRTMDIDTVDNKLYIADNNSISRVNLDDICVEVILQNVSVGDMAVDGWARRIFWTEYLEKKIFVADLGDKKKRVLISTTNYPSRIAFDAKLEYLFWTEHSAEFVRRINLVSNDIVTLANRTFSKSYAIAVDCTKKRVYWLENEIQSGVHHIFSSDYNGLDQKTIVRGLLNDYLLGVLGDSLYYLNNDLFYVNEMNVSNGTISRNILVDNNTYDDLVVVHSSIQPQERMEINKLSCNFEVPNNCQWAQDSSDDFDWTRHQGGTPSDDTGPTTDHTKSAASGWYLYIEASSPRQTNDKARLITPSIREAKSCLLFFYYMYGIDVGKLQVYVKSGGKMDSVWSLSGDQGSGWRQAQVPVNNQMASYQFVIEGVRESYWGDIAIDDISLMDSCSPREIKFSCSFEVPNSCQWAQDSSDDFNWARHQGRTRSSSTGPSTDHTKSSTSGWYLYIEASVPRQPNDKARLISPSTTEVKSCLLFFYHMYGLHVGVLRVYVKSGGKMDSVWSLSGDQDDKWHQAQVAVNNQTTSYQYVIEGVRGKSYWGDIAIDDISLMHSCPPRDKFSCDFEDNICQWTQDKSDDFDWIRNQAFTRSHGTGPLTDHTKGLGSLTNKKQGPGSIRQSGGKCIHVFRGAFIRPKEGEFLVTYRGCGQDRLEFQLWPNGILMLTKYGMCVKPTGRVTDGVKVGVFSSCDATDTWNWTAQGSLQYKKKMCLKPENGAHPLNNERLVLDSVCDERQNFFEFVPTFGWYFYIETSSPGQPNDTARLISPSTTKAKSCLLFFYHMFGLQMDELRVYVKSGGKMYPVWSRSGEQGDNWYRTLVAVNNQTASYQYVIEGVRGKGDLGDIAIDDISVMDSCPPRENQTSKPTSVDNNGSKVFTTPAILPSQTSSEVSTTPAILPSQTSTEDKGTTDDSSRIIIIATTVGAGVFLCIVLIVLLMKYKRCKRAPKLSTPVNIPLETNEISTEPLPVDEEEVYETVPNVDRKFYEDVATNESEDISVEGRTSDHEEVEVPSNAQKASGNTELNKRPDALKSGATGDGDDQAFLKEDDIIEIYIILVPEEPEHETSGQSETCEEPKLSPENPIYT